MDLRRLELLIQVAEFDSFSKAASVLGIAQPALGRQMQKLEEECRVRIFYRHGRGVSLTSEGQTLLERARPLLQQLAAIPADLHAESASPRGLVTVGLMPALCSLFGLELVNAVRKKYPDVRVNIVAAYSGYVHEWLVDGRLDMAVLDDARRSATMAVTPLCTSELFLVRPTAAVPFRLARRPSLASLAQIPLVLPTRNHGLRRTVEHAARQAGVELQIAYEVDTMELLKRMVVTGLACTILGKPAIANELADGTLAAHPLHSPDLKTRLTLATAAGRPHTRTVSLIEGEVKALVAHLVRASSDKYGLSMTS